MAIHYTLARMQPEPPSSNDAPSTRSRGWLWLLDGALLGLILLLPVIWLFGKVEVHPLGWQVRVSWGWKPILGVVALFFCRIWCVTRCRGRGHAVRGPWDVGLSKKLSLAVLLTLSFFVGVEKVLEWRGFSAPLPEIIIRGEESDDAMRTRATIPDRELLWKFNPGADFNGRPVNQLGFLDREVERIKEAGVQRVICMGDSCTGQGIPPYSGFLHERLIREPPDDRQWEAFNMGVHGYSSMQGLRLFQRMGAELEPDVVTLFFGWNDHWLGGQPDSVRMAVTVHPGSRALLAALKRKRFFQWLAKRANPARSMAYGKSRDEWGPRVPHPEYEWTLRTFVREIRSVDAVPVLITAPRADKLADALLEKQARTLEETTTWHDEYVEITRSVGRELNVVVVDLAAVMKGPPNSEIFTGDGIHFTRKGRQVIAQHIYDAIADMTAE